MYVYMCVLLCIYVVCVCVWCVYLCGVCTFVVCTSVSMLGGIACLLRLLWHWRGVMVEEALGRQCGVGGEGSVVLEGRAVL